MALDAAMRPTTVAAATTVLEQPDVPHPVLGHA
jgi:hypothetical protein